MKKNTKKITLLAFAAGLLAAPVVYYIINRLRPAITGEENEDDKGSPVKGLFSAYRGTHKPHHRKAENNN